ncbi:hypothetical protein SAMN05216267_1018136 [Actinacidiphila rubida]|uniref:Uncharacterized protein n=1 Tax=Actinacidiphila rubida TaxID=310780 RepID=A0A1H8MC85_9ACTN|nr:hypothetical protein [Actinacidiphila rubida]SEO14949.1 hypothetical protein SAMN05216267_1018136 [Actinacidiphila rubida]
MALTEAPTATPAPAATRAGTGTATPVLPAPPTGPAAPDGPAFAPVPVWFFAFEGLMGASYDVIKSSPYGWIVLAVGIPVNLVLARTVLRGRLKTAKAILKGRRTRKLAVGLIALRFGVHAALSAIGMGATSGVAHVCFAVVMCATTVALLAFDQRVMLRALKAEAAAA